MQTFRKQDLVKERHLTPDEVWQAVEARLDRPVSEGLNTAHEACDRWARDRARVAIIVRHPDGRSERWTFADLSRVSRRTAKAFAAAGLKPGDRVAAMVGRQIEAWICALAAWRAGFIYVPLFVGFGPDALSQRLDGAGATAVVVDHRYRDTLEHARDLMGSDVQVFCVAGEGGRGIFPGDRSLWAEIDRQSAEYEMHPTAADDIATLLFTSGTTGPPKGCMMPHSAILSVEPFVRHVFALSPADMLFSAADPGWAYGLYTTGACVMALGFPRVLFSGDFDVRSWLQLIDAEQVTYLAAAPTAYRQVAAAAARFGTPKSLRGSTSAGEPLDGPLVTRWRQMTGHNIQDGYGLTDVSMVLGNLVDDDVVPGALASVIPGFDVQLLNGDGSLAEDAGIIAVKKPRYQATIGYWNQEKLWEERWRGEWFLTGDLAKRDEEGRWWFTGRADDLIVTSGYNVGPTEVENVLLEHPDVAEAAVVGAPDPNRGMSVTAFVVSLGQAPREQLVTVLQETVRARVGRHAYPRTINFIEALPRTETGKIRRNVLREQLSKPRAPQSPDSD